MGLELQNKLKTACAALTPFTQVKNTEERGKKETKTPDMSRCQGILITPKFINLFIDMCVNKLLKYSNTCKE